MDQSIIIGLVGLPGAGKTTVANYLEEKGFTKIILSDFIHEEAIKRGKRAVTREILQDIGNSMRETYGPQVLAQLAHKKIRNKGLSHVVIDGIRNLYEIAYLGVEDSFTLIGVTASPKVRYHRISTRKDKKHFSGSYEDFLRQEEREESLGSKETGLRVSECLREATYIIKNDKGFTNLKNKIDKYINKL